MNPCSVSVANYSSMPFLGWVRTTVSNCPLMDAGTVRVGDRSEVVFVRGPQWGTMARIVDLHVELGPNETLVVDLAQAAPHLWNAPPARPDPVGHFGGWPSINGMALSPVSVETEAAGVAMHFRGRFGAMFVDFWALWRDDEPGLVHGEVVACASDPLSPFVVTGTQDLVLSWGDALVRVHGADASWGGPVVASSFFASGQARGVPVTLWWLRHLSADSALAMFAAAQRTIAVRGVDRLLPNGNPALPESFDANRWMMIYARDSLRRLHTWEPALLGPAPESGVTGSQEDQVFVRGESFAPGGLGAEHVAYLAALKLLNRPCHHLQPSGAIVDPTTAMPRLIYWDGKPHWSESVSPNRLGKPRMPTLAEASGWSGPDVEHWLINTLAAAAILNPSRALQWELEHQAMIYLGQWTDTPGWSTTQPYASRAVGWEAIAVVHLWRAMVNRPLAARVRVRWMSRWRDVIEPAYANRAIVDVRKDDPRLGAGDWWLPWQQSVAAYGLDLIGEVFGVDEARSVAKGLAEAVVVHAWTEIGGRWMSAPVAPVPPTGPHPDQAFAESVSAPIDMRKARAWVHADTGVPRWTPPLPPGIDPAVVLLAQPNELVAGDAEAFDPAPLFDESFNLYGMVMAPAVLLRTNPANERARAIWRQCVADNRGHSWLPPGVLEEVGE